MNVDEALKVFGKIKVLHVDDDELQLNMLKIRLEDINDEIIVDSEIDGLKALEKIKTNKYDCILLDYLMPIYDGIEISKRIRSFSNAPIILYTVQGSEEVAERAFNVGVNDYIRKEFNISNYSVLENKIINVVKKHRVLKIFKELINNVQEYIVIIDKEYNINYYNGLFKKHFEEYRSVGSSILNMIEKSDKKRFNDFLINEEETVIEVIIEKTAEEYLYVEIYKSIINNNDDYYVLNIKDVTNQVVKSEIESSSDIRFNIISNLSPDAIIIMNLYGYITYMNPAFTHLTGFTEDEIVGKHMIHMPTMKGRDMKSILSVVKQFFSGKIDTSSFEFPYTRKDGSSGIGYGYGNIIKVNDKREIIVLIKEVTDMEKRSEKEYQHLFETSPDGIIHMGINGIIKSINQSAFKILNIDDKDYNGKSLSDLIIKSDDNYVNLLDIYNKIISDNTKDPSEIYLNTKESSKWIKITVSMIEILDENLGVQILLRDITQQKSIEKDKKIYTDKLETMVEERTNQIMDNEKMVALAKFSSMIAHDLKGPLQIINNSLYLLRKKPDDQEQYLNYIQNATEQASNLIEEMRIQGKGTPLKLEEVNIQNIIDESSIQVKVSEKVELETIIKTNKKIKLDRSKFIRVFNNLLKNAIEAMPNGGKITIIVEEKQSNVSFEVIDTGLGIPEEKLDNLFRPFNTSKTKGMGLGLSFCKQTIEAHGGNISVKSEQGKGTTFTITIPTNTEYDIKTHVDNSIKIKDTLI